MMVQYVDRQIDNRQSSDAMHATCSTTGVNLYNFYLLRTEEKKIVRAFSSGAFFCFARIVS